MKIWYIIHWWIQGRRRHAPPPTGSNSFVFTYVFAKSAHIGGQCPPNSSAPPPPMGNPGSTTDNRSPWARYWVDGLQFGEHIIPLKSIISILLIESNMSLFSYSPVSYITRFFISRLMKWSAPSIIYMLHMVAKLLSVKAMWILLFRDIPQL